MSVFECDGKRLCEWLGDCLISSSIGPQYIFDFARVRPGRLLSIRFRSKVRPDPKRFEGCNGGHTSNGAVSTRYSLRIEAISGRKRENGWAIK